MVTSIIIKNKGSDVTVNNGFVRMAGTCVNADMSSITMSCPDLSAITDIYHEYIESIKDNGLPYVSAISGVRANHKGDVWIVGGKTSQIDVDQATGHITVCDMANTVDYPRIYQSVYAMLKQIRLWIDAHKDSLILSDGDAKEQWLNMLSDKDDWKYTGHALLPSYDTFTEIREDRNKIPAIGQALNLYNEYQSVVALWNYIVATPNSGVSVRLHPADSSGIYVGVNVTVPLVSKKDTTIKVIVAITMGGVSSQSGDNLYMWVRVPMARAIPDESTTIQHTGSPEGDSPESTTASILDLGSQIQGTTYTSTTTCTIDGSKDSHTHTSYVLQTVVEAIPFFLCSESEKTYADSKRSDHVSSSGENEWTISVTVSRDNDIIQTITETKRTAYTTICPDESDSLT